MLFNDLNSYVVEAVLQEMSVYGSASVGVQVVPVMPKPVSKVLTCLSYILFFVSVACNYVDYSSCCAAVVIYDWVNSLCS